MSTRADIILQTSDGYKSIYLHHDGYPSHAFETLKAHYSERETAEALIALGDMSSLAASIEQPEGHTYNTPHHSHSVFYGRDRGEDGCSASEGNLLSGHTNNEYHYLYTLDGEWKQV